MKILVVDDTRIILSVIEAILTKEHQEVLLASDGRQGLQTFCAHEPELIITDIEMPWQDGLSMMKLIRRTHPKVFTLYMTGNPGPYYRQLKEEVDTYGAGLLNKPFTRNDLLQSLTEVVTRTSFPKSRCASLKPQQVPGPLNPQPAKYPIGSLSVANFQREYRYEKNHRPFAGHHHDDGIRAGSRG